MESSIGIVGAGVSGLHLGLYLRQHDVPVTIYAERSPDEVRASRLLNTVGHHHHTLERERALGVHHWDAEEYGYCCHHHAILTPDGPLAFRGDFAHNSSVIDYRLYLPQLMEDFAARGGELVERARDDRRHRARLPEPRPDGRRRRARRDGRAVPAAPRQVAVHQAAAAPVGRHLRGRHLQRAQGRRRALLTGPRRAAGAADLLPRRVRHGAAVRERPGRRPRGARRHPLRRRPGRVQRARAREGPRALPDASPSGSTSPSSRCGRAATSSRAR